MEKYSNWNEKFTRGIQQQIWAGKERISGLKDKSIKIILSEEHEENMMEKLANPKRPMWQHRAY